MRLFFSVMIQYILYEEFLILLLSIFRLIPPPFYTIICLHEYELNKKMYRFYNILLV